MDLTARVISNGQPHRALPLTISLCTAVAARISGTVVAEALSPTAADGPLRLGMPSGILTVGAEVAQGAAHGWREPGRSTGRRGGCSTAGSGCRVRRRGKG